MLIRSVTFDAAGACGRETRCNVGLTAVAGAPPYAGASAYDSAAQVLWVSNGKEVAAYVDGLNGSCEAKCPPMRLRILTDDEWITGMGFRDLTGQLYCTIFRPATATAPAQHRIASFQVQGCELTPLESCVISAAHLPAPVGGLPYVIGGADVFELYPAGSIAGNPIYGSYIVMVASWWGGGLPPGAARNVVLVYQITAGGTGVCQRHCSNPMPMADIGPITGVALEAGTNGVHRIWATSGFQLVAATIGIPIGGPSGSCVSSLVTMCSASAQATFVGLSQMPGPARSAGVTCNEASCPCPFKLIANGDPNYCNLGFRLTVTGGPPSTSGVLTFGIGACVPSIDCANAFEPSGVTASTGFVFGPAAGCGAHYVYNFPTPGSLGSPALLGAIVSVRASGGCASGNPLHSNCLVWAWTGH